MFAAHRARPGSISGPDGRVSDCISIPTIRDYRQPQICRICRKFRNRRIDRRSDVLTTRLAKKNHGCRPVISGASATELGWNG